MIELHKTNDRGGFCITEANGFLYDDNQSRGWAKVENKGYDHFFRLLDDDGVVYAWGWSDDDSSFQPLDEYGSAFGCTEIQYRVAGTSTKFETL